MKNKFLKFFLLSSLLYTTACSEKRLENLGVIKKKANQYSVTRKAPLEMPPDMYLRPPETKKTNKSLAGIKEDEATLDDILAGQKITKNNKRNIKSISKKERILKNIKKAKSTITLK